MIHDDPNNFKRTHKLSYSIACTCPPKGTSVHNKLELANYVTDDNSPYVLTGTVGEQWTISEAKLCKSYTLPGGTPLTPDILNQCRKGTTLCLQTKPGVDVFACHIPAGTKVTVATSWGDNLQANADGVEHGDGDYVIAAEKDGAPDMNDRWVVNGLVFKTTYAPI